MFCFNNIIIFKRASQKKTKNYVKYFLNIFYLLNSSCDADKCPADLGSSLNDLGVGGLPSIIRLWLSASSRLNSWLGVDKWSWKNKLKNRTRIFFVKPKYHYYIIFFDKNIHWKKTCHAKFRAYGKEHHNAWWQKLYELTVS